MVGSSQTAETATEAVSAGRLERSGDDDVVLSKSTIEALAAFRYLLRQFLNYSEDRAREEGITPQQYQLLLVVQGQTDRDWATITEVADGLQIRHNAAVGLVSRCERAKLLRREADEKDRRIIRVSLTEKGLAVTNRIAHQNFGEIKDLLLSLELLFQNGSITMTQAAVVAKALSVDRPNAVRRAVNLPGVRRTLASP